MIKIRKKIKKTEVLEDTLDVNETGMIYGEISASYMGVQSIYQKYKK